MSDCVPPSSDVEQAPEYISITGINNNTAMIINIKTECYFAPCSFFASLCTDIVWLVGFTVFCRGKILYISKGSPRDMLKGGTKQA